MKSFIYTLIAASLVVAFVVPGANSQGVMSATSACCSSPRPADYFSITLRDFTVTADASTQGHLLLLPDNVAFTPGSTIISDDITVVVTDVRIEYTTDDYPRTRLDLVSLGQIPSTDEPVRLHGFSMEDGWQSSLGVIFDSEEAIGRGIAIRKAYGDADTTIHLEISGYVTRR